MEVPCPECNGSGCRDSYRIEEDANGKTHYVQDVVTCLQCGGTGRIYIQNGWNAR